MSAMLPATRAWSKMWGSPLKISLYVISFNKHCISVFTFYVKFQKRPTSHAVKHVKEVHLSSPKVATYVHQSRQMSNIRPDVRKSPERTEVGIDMRSTVLQRP